MRKAALRDDGLAAACLLDAFGLEPSEYEGETVRAYTGALLIVQMMRELTVIRRALTESGKGK